MASRREKELQYLKQQFDNHKGDWLTMEGVNKYRQLANKINSIDSQLVGERSALCHQMMNEYGITELEATNIINGYNASDYVRKYERIRHQIPLNIDDKKVAKFEDDEQE